MGVTWLKWLPTGMESKTRVTSKSNKVNSQKLGVQTQGSDTNKWWFHWNHHRLHDYFIKIRLTSFSYDSVTEGCISVKCQLLTVNFVGFRCQPGFRFDTSGQSLWQSYTQIQAVLVIFFSLALASQPFLFGSLFWLQRSLLMTRFLVQVQTSDSKRRVAENLNLSLGQSICQVYQ